MESHKEQSGNRSNRIATVYLGNWLRDYSQVIDVNALKKVREPLLRAVVSILGFVQFGYATGEFDITAERLGVYRHKEHTGKHSCNCLHEDSDTENYRQPKSQPL